MNRFIQFFLVVILLASCSKKTDSEFIWEKSYGKGIAMFIKASPDSGFIACGEKEGNPYFVRTDKKKNVVIDFQDQNPGSFTSAWFDTTCYIAGGSSLRKMLLVKYDKNGTRVWDKLFSPGFEIDITRLFYKGNGVFLAIGSAAPESETAGGTGLFFVEFDTTGTVLTENEILDDAFISAGNAIIDNTDNVILALTRKEPGSKTKASVAKFNSDFNRIWETQLFNNPGFGSASISLAGNSAGDIFIAGKTELDGDEGTVYNSFLASIGSNGTPGWKKYLEHSNSASAVIFDDDNTLLLLNRNCFVINFLESTGTDAGRMRIFNLCDSYNTDALSEDIDLNFDSDYLLAGTRGGSFYVALKPAP